MTSFEKSEALSATKHLPHPKYRADIDGLRAIAVLAVIIFHAFPSKLRGGFVGVDIFFVISGFLISSIIIGGLERGTFSFSEFYSRRVNRIFPALIAVLAAVWAFSWFGLFPGEFEQLGKHMAGGAAFISNFLLLGEAGYFDSSAETKVLLHLWSLGVEEQFYLIWPIILWLAWKIRFSIPATIAIFMAASFALNIYSVNIDPTEAFYSPQTRFWELLIGASLAYFSSFSSGSHPAVSTKLKSIISVIAFILILLSIKSISKKYMFPGWWALIPAISAAAIIYAGPHAWVNRKILSSRVMVFIGLISFPLYLWHWPLLVLARVIEGDTPSRNIRVAMLLISIFLAWITYVALEKPLRKNKSKLKTPALLLAMAITGAVGYATFLSAGFPERAGVKQAEIVSSQFVGPIWKFSQNDICNSRYPFEESKDYGWWFCIANKDEAPSLLLLGNSFANHLFPGLSKAEETAGNSILSIGTCPVSQADDKSDVVAKSNSPCAGNRSYHQKLFVNDVIEKSGSIKYAIIDGLPYSFDEDETNQVHARIDYLEKQGIQVIVFVPHIISNESIKKCFSRPFKARASDCIVSTDLRQMADDGFAPLKKSIEATNPKVKFFDQNELFCDSARCSLILNGMPIYRDESSHYTEYASYQVAQHFIKWAKTNAPGVLMK